jgi:hypothetical protein
MVGFSVNVTQQKLGDMVIKRHDDVERQLHAERADLTQHEWFCIDGGFSAKTSFTVPFAAFIADTLIWHWMDAGPNWIAYRHNVRWHWILAII